MRIPEDERSDNSIPDEEYPDAYQLQIPWALRRLGPRDYALIDGMGRELARFTDPVAARIAVAAPWLLTAGERTRDLLTRPFAPEERDERIHELEAAIAVACDETPPTSRHIAELFGIELRSTDIG